jgi:hypothetical protein
LKRCQNCKNSLSAEDVAKTYFSFRVMLEVRRVRQLLS